MSYTPPPQGASASARGILKLTNDLGGTADLPTVPIAARVTGGGMETVSAANATGTRAVNLANGNVFDFTLTGNVTQWTFSGATNGKACSCTVYITQNATSAKTVAWTMTAGTLKWAGGTAPTVSSTLSATDIFVFETLDGGTTWYGSLVGSNF